MQVNVVSRHNDALRLIGSISRETRELVLGPQSSDGCQQGAACLTPHHRADLGTCAVAITRSGYSRTWIGSLLSTRVHLTPFSSSKATVTDSSACGSEA